MSVIVRLRARLEAFRIARGGNVAVMFGLALVPLVAGVGASVDYSRANSTKSHLQAAADSAALFAARGSYGSDSQRVAAGVNAFNASYPAQFGTASPTVTVADGTITVTATASVPTAILSAVGVTTLAVNVTSVVHIGGGATACVLALQTSDDGIFVHGGSSLKANCGLYANSTSSDAIDFDGDSVTSATSICVVGNYDKDSSAKVTPTPQVKCAAMTDPLASLPVPSNASASCTYNKYEIDGTGTLNPGVYCGGIKIGSSAKATFNAGVYIIRDGQFNIGSSAQVTGQNVTFYFTGSDANLDQGSSSYMNFTAPSSGTYKGIVFFQSRTANTSANRFGGSSNTVVQGAVYFPNGTAEINCNGSVMANGDYTVWIVKRLQIDSGATLQVNSKYSTSSTPLADGLSKMVLGSKTFLSK